MREGIEGANGKTSAHPIPYRIAILQRATCNLIFRISKRQEVSSILSAHKFLPFSLAGFSLDQLSHNPLFFRSYLSLFPSAAVL
jgi:hypothetical protein